MRKLLISLLLAGAAATPALADPGDHHDRQAERAERQQARAERQESRTERQAPQQRPQFTGEARANGPNTGGQQGFARSERFQQPMSNPGQQQIVQQQVVQQQNAGQDQALRAERQRMRAARAANGDDNARNWRRDQRQQGFPGGAQSDDQLRQSDRPPPNVLRTRGRTPMVGEFPRQGTQPPMRVDNRRGDHSRWNTNWRHDDRYDWRRWRDRHRSSFHLGVYFDPFNWGYQPFSIGWRLWPNYYSSNYWINDPWQYRLPYAPPGTRWIRYYNDALLVDTYSGEVVDAIRNFFW